MPEGSLLRAVVVYYSRFGHTAKVAEVLAQELGAEVRRIEETRQRGYPGMAWGAIIGACFKLKPMDMAFLGFDLLVLCTPIWAARPACPARTFLRDARIEGKPVAVLISTASGETGKALEIISRDLARKNARIITSNKVMTCKGNGEPTDDELRQAARDFARKVKGAGI